MEKKSRKSIIIGMTILVLVTLILVGLTYAYYRTRIIGNQNDTSISVTSKKLEVTYVDGSSTFSTSSVDEKIKPGFVYKKQFSVNNTGDDLAYYSVVLDNVVNEFNKGTATRGNYNDWSYKLYSGTSLEDADLTSANLISENIITSNNYQVVKDNISIDAKGTHDYVLVIEYANLDNVDQSDDMDQEFSLRVNIANEGNFSEVLSEITIGDKVNYTYLKTGETTRTYATSGEESYGTTVQTIDAAGANKVESWSVLRASEEEGIVLIADLPETVTAGNGLNLYGAKGYANASEVLNGIASLYSSEYGEARSVNESDIVNAVGTRTETPYYTNESGVRTNNAVSSTDLSGQQTIKEIEDSTGASIAEEYRIAIDGYNFDDLVPYTYQIRGYDVKQNTLKNNPELWSVIFEGTNSASDAYEAPYWVDGKKIEVNFKKDQVKFRLDYIAYTPGTKDTAAGGLGSRHMWNNLEGDQSDLANVYYFVRPIVILNKNLTLEKNETTGVWNIS